MYIAIKYEKINICEGKFIFKPISIIKGEYNEEYNVFFEENGTPYFSIGNVSLDKENYFAFPIKEETLLKNSEYDVLNPYLIGSYLSTHKQNLYFGLLDEESGVIKLVEVTDDDLNKDTKESTKKENKATYSVKRKESKKFNLARFRKSVLNSIVGQDEAVYDITRTIGINYTSKDINNKSHIMIIGPSGTGKSQIAHIVSSKLKVPYINVNATDYGKNWNVNSILIDLVKSTEGDIEKAQNGIIIIDKLDEQLLTFEESVRIAIINVFTEIMQRKIVNVELGDNGRFDFDTSNLTLIFTGKFDEIYKIAGFSNGDNKDIKYKDFIDCGLTNDFLKQIGTITFTHSLNLDDLVNILSKSKISPLKIKKDWFKDQGIKVKYNPEFYREIANKCLKLGYGAHPLQMIVNDSLKGACDYALEGNDKTKTLVFTKETISNPKKYYIK